MLEGLVLEYPGDVQKILEVRSGEYKTGKEVYSRGFESHGSSMPSKFKSKLRHSGVLGISQTADPSSSPMAVPLHFGHVLVHQSPSLPGDNDMCTLSINNSAMHVTCKNALSVRNGSKEAPRSLPSAAQE